MYGTNSTFGRCSRMTAASLYRAFDRVLHLPIDQAQRRPLHA
ncbi:MAG: hypothetical protein QM754_07350 [Tepidisphaeraceae bacterium]